MSESPFGGIGETASSTPDQPAQTPQSNVRAHLRAIIGAVLVLVGFAWKFFAGSAAGADSSTLVDAAWLVPIAVGGALLVWSMRRRT
ncbi:MAG TPA: hypothetical protein VFC06_06830 [Demequina sp.]|nr:hypothetical protein [Demequina sp.]